MCAIGYFFIIVVFWAQNINILLSNFAKTFTTLQTSLVLYLLLPVFKLLTIILPAKS
jgi:hypothetical protein